MTRKFNVRVLYLAFAVLAIWLACLGVKTVRILTAPRATSLDASEHGATIHFEADRSAVLFNSDCINVAWRADHIQAVFLGEDGQIGQGTSEQCGNDLHLNVKFQDDEEATYELPRDVLFDVPNSLITLALGATVLYLLAAQFLVSTAEPDAPSAKRREIRPLTSYRAFAAAMVFFFHAPLPVDGALAVLQDKGFMGVSFFFVLSGFLIATRYADDIANRTFKWRLYMIRRVARILPVYYTVVIFAALWHEPFNIIHLTLTQSYFPDYWTTGISPAWTLTLEETFYLTLPLILWLCWRSGRKWLVLAGVVALFYAVGLALVAVGAYESHYMLMRTIFGQMVDFMIGVGAAFAYRRWQPGKRAWILTLICAVTFVLWAQLLAAQGEAVTIINGGWVLSLIAAGLILSLTSPSGWIVKILSLGPLVYLGRISYALYLIQLARPIDELRGTLQGFLGDYSNVVLYGIVTLICIVIYQLVEKPAHNWILRRFNATGGAKAASPQSTSEVVTSEK